MPVCVNCAAPTHSVRLPFYLHLEPVSSFLFLPCEWWRSVKMAFLSKGKLLCSKGTQNHFILSCKDATCKNFFNAKCQGWGKKEVKFFQVKIFSRDQVDRWLLGPLAPASLLPIGQVWNPECLCLLQIHVSERILERIPITILQNHEGWQSGRAGMPVSLSWVQDAEIAFLFERVWKTLPAPWLEKLLPLKRHFEIAIIILSLALILPTAQK